MDCTADNSLMEQQLIKAWNIQGIMVTAVVVAGKTAVGFKKDKLIILTTTTTTTAATIIILGINCIDSPQELKLDCTHKIKLQVLFTGMDWMAAIVAVTVAIMAVMLMNTILY